ncbi:MAG: hypothetical protein JNL97_09945 [Verrucomicrobiales bacterium]|nr:hypothetical protein [Verrucomicrobiales bacterium]
MKHWKAILAATLIFVTGAATGALAFRAASKAEQRPREPGGPPPMMDRRFDFLGRLKKDLDLTEEQTTKIDVVLQEGSKRTRQLWETVQPQMHEEMKRVTDRIKAELTPEQRTRFDEQSKKFRERRGPRSSGTNAPGESFRRGPRFGPPPPDGDDRGPRPGPGPHDPPEPPREGPAPAPSAPTNAPPTAPPA